jgi:hypothetical protein
LLFYKYACIESLRGTVQIKYEYVNNVINIYAKKYIRMIKLFMQNAINYMSIGYFAVPNPICCRENAAQFVKNVGEFHENLTEL